MNIILQLLVIGNILKFNQLIELTSCITKHLVSGLWDLNEGFLFQRGLIFTKNAQKFFTSNSQ